MLLEQTTAPRVGFGKAPPTPAGATPTCCGQWKPPEEAGRPLAAVHGSLCAVEGPLGVLLSPRPPRGQGRWAAPGTSRTFSAHVPCALASRWGSPRFSGPRRACPAPPTGWAKLPPCGTREWPPPRRSRQGQCPGDLSNGKGGTVSGPRSVLQPARWRSRKRGPRRAVPVLVPGPERSVRRDRLSSRQGQDARGHRASSWPGRADPRPALSDAGTAAPSRPYPVSQSLMLAQLGGSDLAIVPARKQAPGPPKPHRSAEQDRAAAGCGDGHSGLTEQGREPKAEPANGISDKRAARPES